MLVRRRLHANRATSLRRRATVAPMPHETTRNTVVRYDRDMMKAIAVVAVLATSAGAQTPNATTVLGNVQQFYTGTKQLSAKFRQHVTNNAFGKTSTSDGELWVQKPGSVRFDYVAKTHKVDKSFVFDGTTAWMVDHKNLQIAKQQASTTAMPAAMSFLTGGKQLAQQFNVALSTSGMYGKTVLELTPEQPSAQYKQLFFVVDPKDWHVTKSIVIDSKGDTNEFDLFAPDVKTVPAPSLFKVDPKALPSYKLVSGPPSGSSSPARHP